MVGAALGFAPRVRLDSPGSVPSLKSAARRDFAAAINECWLLWDSFGSLCPRARDMRKANIPSEASRSLQEEVFKGNFQSPDGVLQMVRSLRVLLHSFESYSWSVWDASEWQVAAVLRDQHCFGKTRCVRLYRACVWAEKCFGMQLQTSSPLVLGQRSLPADVSTPAPKPARMARLEFIMAMERLTQDGLTLPMRCWAGAFCCLTHGVLRWSDFQRSEGLHLTPDAVVGTSWKMKKKLTKVPWAALRTGVTGFDWGGAWWTALAEACLPSEDFVMYKSDGCLQYFVPEPARFYHAQAAMRLLLAGPPLSLDLVEALTYSCHSWRHVYPTAGKQLLMSNEQVNAMGHWDTHSRMPLVYDSKACVTELVLKSQVMEALQDGWRISDAGTIPMPRPPSKIAASSPNSSELYFVTHGARGRLHVWSDGLYSMCRRWKCGTRSSPESSASFGGRIDTVEAPEIIQCLVCFSSPLVQRTQMVDEQDLVMSSGSDSDDDLVKPVVCAENIPGKNIMRTKSGMLMWNPMSTSPGA